MTSVSKIHILIVGLRLWILSLLTESDVMVKFGLFFLALTVIINIEFWLVVNGWPVAVDYQPSFETEWWKLKLLLLPSRRILAVFHDVFCKALIMRGIMRLGAVHIG